MMGKVTVLVNRSNNGGERKNGDESETSRPLKGGEGTNSASAWVRSSLSPSNAENTIAHPAAFVPRKKGFETMMKDSRDEEDEEDDDDCEEDEENSSMGYSDDNSSFGGSDAYFRPQPGDDSARPYTRLIFGNGPVNPYQTKPPPLPILSSSPTVSYGSLQHSADGSLQYSIDGSLQFSMDGSMGYSMDNRNNLVPWLGGVPIQEDVEASIPYQFTNLRHHSRQSSTSNSDLPPIPDADLSDVAVEASALLPGIPLHHANSNTSSKQHKPKHKKKRNRSRQQHQHRMQMRAREHQMSQEKVVSLVKGRVQDLTAWHDSFWAILFVVQLVLVILCALRYGFGVILFKPRPVWGGFPEEDNDSNTTTSIWKGLASNGTRFLVALVNQTLTHTTNNTTTESNLDDDLMITVVPNATLKDILFSHDDNAMKTDDVLDSALRAGGSFTIDYKNVLAITFFAGFYACILSYISFGFMLILARSLILIMLIFSILVALAWGVVGLTLDPYGVISFMGFGALLSTLGYTMYSWNRIPFAATNLYTALTAMRCTADIIIMGLLSLVVAFGWCLLWSMAFIGIVNAFNHHDCKTNDDCEAHVNPGYIPLCLLFFVSFHWTTMVIKNVVRVTVASAVGTWWCHPNDIGGFCSAAVIRPLFRSLTYSLGSICFGSLVVSPAQLTLSFARLCCCCIEGDAHLDGIKCIGHGGSSNGKPLPFLSFEHGGEAEEGAGVVADIRATVDSPADSIYWRFCSLARPCNRWLRACNQWGFTYIGLYGYPFVEAGDRALQLFETRGWTEVVEDTLIQNVLLMASVVIGGSTGVFAVVVEETDGYDFTSFHQPIITAFVIGSVLGYVLSNILLLGVVGSAVNTILVCFAAVPFEFERNHPRLSHEMREVWSQQLWEPKPAPQPKFLQQQEQLPYLKTAAPPAAASSIS